MAEQRYQAVMAVIGYGLSISPAWRGLVLRTREVTDGGHLVAVPGGSEADRGV